jgi:hypothetical protein
MQLPHADPHDAIAAQLRDLSARRAHDSSELNVTSATSPEPASEPPLRATPLNDNAGDIRIPTPRARSGRGVVVLLAVCAGVAATMAWHSYGDEAKQRLSSLVPQLFAQAPASTQSANAAEPQDVTSQIAAPQPAAEPAPAQEVSNVAPATPTPPAPAAATPAAETPPTQVALPPEVTQSIETMAREIASLKQTVEQLQAGQQQLSRDVAKANEHGTRHKVAEQASKPTPRPRPRHTSAPAAASRTVAPYSPPPPVYSQSQPYQPRAVQHDAYIPPPAPAPRQLPPQPGDSSAPRPPMPLQ